MSFVNRIDATLRDGPQLDASGRLRISSPTSLFDFSGEYNDGSTFRWSNYTVTGATITHLPNISGVRLSTTTTTGSIAIRQSRAYIRYQPGRSQMIQLTFVMGDIKAGVIQRIGYFDPDNGIFLEQNGTERRFVRRTKTSGSVVDNAVAQSAWNLDKLDGTGPSGVTLDMTKNQLMVIDLQWLGSGRVRVGFNIGGRIIYAHEFLNANVLTVPYMTTASLPVRYELIVFGSPATPTDMDVICCSVFNEDSFGQEHALRFTANTGATLVNITGRRPILSLRPNINFVGIKNTVRAFIKHVNVLTTTNNVLVEVVYNGSLTGAVFADVNTNESTLQVDTTATAISGGVIIASKFVSTVEGSGELDSVFNNNDSPYALLNDTLSGTQRPISIVATPLTSPANVGVAVNWAEIR